MNPRTPPAFGLSAAIHVLLTATAVWLSQPVPRGPGARVAIVMVGSLAAASSVQAAERKAAASPRVIPTAEEDPLFTRHATSATLDIPGFQIDYGKVADRARWLFPFLSLRIPLDATPPARGTPTRLFNPFGRGRAAKSSLPPLLLGDAALQTLVDSAWSRRERWRPFQPIIELTDRYNPDSGRLPALLRRYVDQNVLQPYLDTINRDPRLWTELRIAADHRDFIDFITRYAARHPSTKTTTELMFLLEKLAQGSFDALITLIDTGSHALEWTQDKNREAFELLGVLRRFHGSELEVRDLGSRPALRAFYDIVRVAILTEIVNTTPDGYRASDARFLIGAIYWRAGRTDEAVRWWRGLTPDPADGYADAATQILDVVRRNERDGGRLDRGRINEILDEERRGWVNFWEARLLQFGYAFDTY